MFQLRKKLIGNEIGHLFSEQTQRLLAPVLTSSVQPIMLIKNKAIDDKDRLSKPRSQIKGVDLLRNPSLFKVNLQNITH